MPYSGGVLLRSRGKGEREGGGGIVGEENRSYLHLCSAVRGRDSKDGG